MLSLHTKKTAITVRELLTNLIVVIMSQHVYQIILLRTLNLYVLCVSNISIKS